MANHVAQPRSVLLSRATRLLMALAALALLVSLLGAARPPASIDVPGVTNIRVSADRYRAHSEPYLAVNPDNPRNLLGASKFFTDPAHYRFRIGAYVSFDGGATWHDNGVLPGLPDYTVTSDTTVAFDAHGNGYVVALAVRSVAHDVRSGVFIWHTNDGGRTFSAPVPVFEDAGFQNDKPWLAVDRSGGPAGGTIYVAWVQLRDRGRHASVAFSRSTDSGQHFSAPLTISSTQDRYTQGPVITAGPGGQVQVAYIDLGRALLEVAGSTDHGQRFGLPRPIWHVGVAPDTLPHATFRLTSMPAVAVDPRDGTLYVAWTDFRGGDAAILLAHSADGGLSWSQPVRVGDQPGTKSDQFMPQLAVTPKGSVYVSYFDNHLDPNRRLLDVYLAYSTDRGATFASPRRITTVSWDPAVDAPVVGRHETFIGDYQGLAAGPTAIYPFWNDTRTGSQEIFTAAVQYGPLGV